MVGGIYCFAHRLFDFGWSGHGIRLASEQVVNHGREVATQARTTDHRDLHIGPEFVLQALSNRNDVALGLRSKQTFDCPAAFHVVDGNRPKGPISATFFRLLVNGSV